MFFKFGRMLLCLTNSVRFFIGNNILLRKKVRFFYFNIFIIEINIIIIIEI